MDIAGPAIRSSTGAGEAVRWTFATRLAFRFAVVYFGIFIVSGQMLTSLLFAATNDGGAFEVDYTRPVQRTIEWVAAHLFGISHPLVTTITGSGDRQFDWVELACIAFLAVLGTLVWSLWDRRRTAYSALFRWAHAVARFALGATLLSYGAAKIIPLQMPYPNLMRLIEPYGHFSPMGVLWASIGAAPGYEIFAGIAEFAAGVLLLFSRTATLGALLGLADAVQVFMLNMTYDVPVKILSFHLIPLALFVLAPDTKRLLTAMLTNRPAAPAPDRRLFRGTRAHRWSLLAQAVFALYPIVGNLVPSLQAVSVYGPKRPRSPLYGIWQVTAFSLDGAPHPPLATDATRWNRVIFDYPTAMAVEAMNDQLHRYPSTIDVAAHTITVKQAKQTDILQFTPGGADTMTITGSLDGHRLEAALQRTDLNKLTLVGRGFHWVQDRPYNH